MGKWDYPDKVHDYAHDNNYWFVLQGVKREIIYEQSNIRYLQYLNNYNLRLLPWFMYDESLGKLFNRGPSIADKPGLGDRENYIYPSYIIWKDDNSYILNSEYEIVELPLETLRQTEGRPQSNFRPDYDTPVWISDPRLTQPVSPMAGRHKRQW